MPWNEFPKSTPQHCEWSYLFTCVPFHYWFIHFAKIRKIRSHWTATLKNLKIGFVFEKSFYLKLWTFHVRNHYSSRYKRWTAISKKPNNFAFGFFFTLCKRVFLIFRRNLSLIFDFVLFFYQKNSNEIHSCFFWFADYSSQDGSS